MSKHLICTIFGHSKPCYEAIFRGKHIIKWLTCPRCDKKLSIIVYENNELIYSGQEMQVVEALMREGN